MTADVVVGTLRTADGSATAARSTVDALVPLSRAYGRGILMVRHLSARVGDGRGARAQVAEYRRTGARPAHGWVDPRAEAVYFDDEAELLLCFSEDLLRGDANGRWWWTTRLARYGTDPPTALAAAWLHHPRWVPQVLNELARRLPDEVRGALGQLPASHAAAVLAAVAAEHLGAMRTSSSAALPPADVSSEPSSARRAAADLVGPARVLLVLSVTVTRHPGLMREPSFLGWIGAATHAGAAYGPSAAAMSLSRGGRTIRALQGEATPTGPWMLNDDPAANGTTPSVDADVIPLRRRDAGPDGDRSADPPHWQQRPWEGGGAQTDTDMATALYTVNLVDRLNLETVAAETSTGWAVVETITRWLLRDVPARRRRRLLDDPLLTLLGELDTRPPGVPNPVRPGPWLRPVEEFMRVNGLDASTFTRPGRLVVSRTHVDVALGLDQIDMAVRACGLDQDPGWVPTLGRIVLFHFGEPT